MYNHRSRTTDAYERQIAQLRQRVQQAQVGERCAQALLESVSSLVGLSDTDAVLAGLAESAVGQIGLPRVSAYRADHDAGTLVEVSRAEQTGGLRETAAQAPLLPPVGEMAGVEMVEVDAEPIPMQPGDPLAEFALGDEGYELVPPVGGNGEGAELHEALLVRISRRPLVSGPKVSGRPRSGPAHGRDASAHQAPEHHSLVGILRAFCDRPVSARQVILLQALASLGAAATEVARAEQFRDQLVSAVSHELRTPLASIQAYNELLLDEDAGEINEEQREFLERIQTTCLRLNRMVEDLLDLSRLRAGEMVVRKEPVDVAAVIEHILDTLSPEAARQAVTMSKEIQADLPVISSNADRLTQVLFNLVGNAIKYVGEGDEVLVRAEVQEDFSPEVAQRPQTALQSPGDPARGRDCLVIEVIDNGPGIAPEDQERIFDEFYRAGVMESSTKGSGLGLAIAQRLTRLLGGMLDVESTLGEGSRFILAFPLSQLLTENAR
jgi:signal transduction histidine kinase